MSACDCQAYEAYGDCPHVHESSTYESKELIRESSYNAVKCRARALALSRILADSVIAQGAGVNSTCHHYAILVQRALEEYDNAVSKLVKSTGGAEPPKG